jgi:hypothetical protein
MESRRCLDIDVWNDISVYGTKQNSRPVTESLVTKYSGLKRIHSPFLKRKIPLQEHLPPLHPRPGNVYYLPPEYM